MNAARHRHAAALALAIALCARQANADPPPDEERGLLLPQVVEQPAPAPPTPRHTGIIATLKALPHDFYHLGSLENTMWVAIGSGAALAAHPFDDNVNRHFQGAGAADAWFGPGKYIGETATLAASSLTVYAVGRLADEPKVSHIGMDLIRALVVDEALTQTLKHAVGRERPDGSDNHSFPSGHSSATFAVATVLERHLNWKLIVPAYLFSSYIGVSRLHENKHFLSDVAFGAAVGIISGRTVTRPGSDHYAIMVVPARGGVALLVTLRNPA
jgi:hypothetical protein